MFKVDRVINIAEKRIIFQQHAVLPESRKKCYLVAIIRLLPITSHNKRSHREWVGDLEPLLVIFILFFIF